MPFGQSCPGFRSAGLDLSCRRDANEGGEIGRAATLAGLPGLRIWWNWPPGGTRTDMRETVEPEAVLAGRPRYVPGGIFHPVGTQTNGSEIIERCCCLGGTASVISPPESTSRADESSAGEKMERRVTSAAAPLRSPSAEFPEQATENDARASSKRWRLCAESPWLVPRRS